MGFHLLATLTLFFSPFLLREDPQQEPLPGPSALSVTPYNWTTAFFCSPFPHFPPFFFVANTLSLLVGSIAPLHSHFPFFCNHGKGGGPPCVPPPLALQDGVFYPGGCFLSKAIRFSSPPGGCHNPPCFFWVFPPVLARFLALFPGPPHIWCGSLSPGLNAPLFLAKKRFLGVQKEFYFFLWSPCFDPFSKGSQSINSFGPFSFMAHSCLHVCGRRAFLVLFLGPTLLNPPHTGMGRSRL